MDPKAETTIEAIKRARAIANNENLPQEQREQALRDLELYSRMLAFYASQDRTKRKGPGNAR